MKKIFLIISIIFFPSAVLAAPSVSGVSGTVSHGQNITVSGSAFGTKSPVAPVLWDDGTSNSTIDNYYAEYQPTAATEGSVYNMQYRDMSFLSGRGITLPNERMSYVLGGAHACSNIQPTEDCSYASGSNVHLLVPIPSWPTGSSPRFYVQYWYRYDPNFDEVCTDNNNGLGCYNFTSGGENCKQLVLSSSESSIFPGQGNDDWGYYQLCNSDCPDVNDLTSIKFSRLDSDCNSAHSSCSGNATYHNSPINEWMQWIWIGGYDDVYDNPTAEIWTFPDGHRTYQMDDGRPLTTFEILGQPQCGQPDNSRWESVGIGSFARVPRYNIGTNSFRYFAGVYVDDTYARIMLTDNATYESSTIVEPQIPSAWSDGSLTAEVNLGKLPDTGTAYLFVFDSNNEHNAQGYPITLGGGGGDITPPAAPSSLSVE